jgi:hypothetical protein
VGTVEAQERDRIRRLVDGQIDRVPDVSPQKDVETNKLRLAFTANNLPRRKV